MGYNNLMSIYQGGYKNLTVYMLSCVIYDLTVEFCNRYISKYSRTFDQMVQAARSGKQNIAEGHTFKSLKSYIKLLGVSHGSTKELHEDYEDFLRQRKLQLWRKDDTRVKVFRDFRVSWISENTLNTPNLPNNPEQAANMLITFCNLNEFLLLKLIKTLEQKFINEGGYSENLFKKRLQNR